MIRKQAESPAAQVLEESEPNSDKAKDAFPMNEY
jgi:hypothetical protein